MPGVPPPPLTSDSEFTSGIAEQAYITARAKALGIDPRAALAVATHEGGSLPSAEGDGGHSFGPWQLYSEGALPPQVWRRGPGYAQQWANSPSGIDYALAAIAHVSKGETGYQAVSDIVNNFEHPMDPAAEIAASWATYQSHGTPRIAAGPGAGTSITTDIGHGASAVGGAITGVVSKPINSVLDFLKEWVVRGALIIVGTGVALIGLYLIARSFGLPSVNVLDKATTVASRGTVRPGAIRTPVAATRGEPVTRVSRPEPLDRASRRHAAGVERGRQRAARSATRERDRLYGGADDIPF